MDILFSQFSNTFQEDLPDCKITRMVQRIVKFQEMKQIFKLYAFDST